MKNKDLLKKISTAIGFVFLAFAVMTFYMSYTNYQEKLSNIKSSSDVNGTTPPAQQASVSTNTNDSGVTEDDLRALQSSALAAATKICDLQNESTLIMSRTATKDEINQVIANREEMCKYFDNAHFGECWFMSSTDYPTAWTVIMPLDYSTTYVPVVWECVDEQGHLYAYATGVYQQDGTFDDMRVLVTSYGASKQPYTKVDDTLLDERSLDEWLSSIEHILQRNGHSLYEEEVDPDIDITFPDKYEEGHDADNKAAVSSAQPAAETVPPSAPDSTEVGGND